MKTKEIEIEVGLHQGSALSPLLFVIIIDVITEEIDEGTPWAMLFADDLVLFDPDREMMEVRLERRRECMEKNGQQLTNRTPIDNMGHRSGQDEEIHGDRSCKLANSTIPVKSSEAKQ